MNNENDNDNEYKTDLNLNDIDNDICESLMDSFLIDLYSTIKSKCEYDFLYILDKPKQFHISNFIELMKKYIY